MICSIEGCGKPARSKGLCTGHYHRKVRHGDPLGGDTPKGEPHRYFRDVVMAHEGDECLPWPFAVNNHGYGLLWLDGRLQLVTRIICREIHGEPLPGQDAAHSCGNGHLKCVTKSHLFWRTRQENVGEMIAHGRALRGSLNSRALLSEKDVLEIKGLLGSVTQTAIAASYGVSRATIYKISAGKMWAHL